MHTVFAATKRSRIGIVPFVTDSQWIARASVLPVESDCWHRITRLFQIESKLSDGNGARRVTFNRMQRWSMIRLIDDAILDPRIGYFGMADSRIRE